jgi:amidase
MNEELHWLTITQTVSLIEAKKLSASEFFDHIARRIESFNPQLNAFVATDLEHTRDHAKRIDDLIQKGESVGSLVGAFIGLKDICATEEFPTRMGSVALDPFLPGEDSEIAAKVREADGSIVGKLTTTEAAFMDHHESIRVPINPWDENSWTGVSSSGSGVATAAGLCSASFGTDTGGSIRFPALCCGLVGLKPTQNLLSVSGIFPLAPTMDHVGPMTRSVEDAALLLESVGREAGRENQNPPFSFRKDVGKPTDNLRVGFDEKYCTEGVDPQITRCIRTMVDHLRDEGITIVELPMPSSEVAVANFPVIVSSEAALVHSKTPEDRFKDYSPGLRDALLAGKSFSALDYVKANSARREFSAKLDESFDQIDVFIAPSWGRTTPTLAEYEQSTDSELAALIRFTAPQNLAGLPALCLPGGLDRKGVPFGFQLFGSQWGDAEVLRIGALCERFTGFLDKHPVLVA